MKRQLLLGSAGLLLFSGWVNHLQNRVEEAAWLLGTWESKTPRGSIYETWNRTSTDAFAGKSYMVKNKDTMVFETIVLKEEQNGLVYEPAVKNQNKGQAVFFRSTEVSGSKLVFENPQHDFPQVISYQRIGKDSLVAEISGNKNGKPHQQVFPMKRLH